MGVWGKTLIACAMAALAGEVAPVAAQALEPSGEWAYRQQPEACSATRTFGSEGERVVLQLRSFGPNSAIEVTVGRADLPREPWSARLMEVGWDGGQLEHDQLAVLASIGGLPSATLLMGYRPALSFFKGEINRTVYWGTPLNLGAETLQLRGAGIGPIDLKTGSLSEAVARLAECEHGLLEQWGWGSDYLQRIASDPELIDRSNVSPTIVYPAPMVINRISNFAELRLKIDPTGRVAECIVQSSPANRRFGEDSCKTIRRKIRYTPARDQQGEAVESFAQMAIAFGVIY